MMAVVAKKVLKNCSNSIIATMAEKNKIVMRIMSNNGVWIRREREKAEHREKKN